MKRKSEPEQQSAPRQPSAAAGLLFLLGGLGSFYGFLSVVDPLL